MKINPALGAQFVGSMDAAADFLGNGAIEVNMYETEIFDLVRRSSPIFDRVKAEPATGHPHRFFEETAIGQGQFTDPRTISYSATGSTRQEDVVYIKAMVNGSNFGLFDVQVTQQQGQFSYVEAKDVNDIINGIQVVRCKGIWQGTDTSYSSPTTIQYYGLLNQITQQATIAPGTVDHRRAEGAGGQDGGKSELHRPPHRDLGQSDRRRPDRPRGQSPADHHEHRRGCRRG